MPNDQQDYTIKLGGQLYKFKADAGLSQEAAIDYAAKKYPQFAEAYKAHQPPKQDAAAEPKFAGWMTPGLSTDEASKAAMKMDQSKLPGYFQPMSPTGISVDPQHARTEATQLGAAVGGAGVGLLMKSLEGGGLVLPKIVQAMYRAGGTGVGAAGGAATSGAGPGESMMEGVKYSAMELGGELAFGAASKGYQLFSKLWKADPKRMTDLAELVSASDKIKEMPAIKNPREALSALDAQNYPQTSARVKLMPAAKVAQQAEKDIAAGSLETVPAKVSKLADIGRARQAQALRSLAKAGRILQGQAGGTTEEVEALLAKAKSQGELDFMDAQKLYSSLGRAIAQGKGMLPFEQYEALSNARDAMEESMKSALQFETSMGKAAKAAGVMPEGELGDFYRFRDSQTGGSFSVRKSEYSAAKMAEEVSKLRKSIPDTTQLDPLAQQKVASVRDRFEQWQPADHVAQWEKAQAAHKQFIDDFFNPAGPLNKIVKADPAEREKILKHLLVDPDTRARATAAMARNGLDTTDVIKLAAKWRDPTQLGHAINDAARLEQLGQDIFVKQEVGATRKAFGKAVLKRTPLYGLVGYELWKALQGKSPTLFRSQP